MSRAALALALACACAGLVIAVQNEAGARTPQSTAGRTMAVTFDDLPYVALGSSQFVADAQRVTTEILRVLQRHRAPVVGFVNEAQLAACPDRAVPAARGSAPPAVSARCGPGTAEGARRRALLQQWVDAGAVLGNHTYSHPDFNAVTVSQFEDEIVRGEVVTRQLMASRGPYQLYFRHPMTHTGDTAEKKAAIEAFLASRGYKVAPHTVENSDFVFNVPYVQVRRANDRATSDRAASDRGASDRATSDGAMSDRATRDRVVQAYLDFTLAALGFAERIAPQIFGREIPQTLLVHANDITADALDRMLTAFEQRGYRFITLDDAMADAAYQTKDTLVSRSGPTWLWRWMKSKGMSVSFAADPEVPAWVAEAYARR